MVAALVSASRTSCRRPLLVIAGPTASGKSTMALRLAQEFPGEIVSCDSVAIYREMEIGTAKPSAADRALVPHHLLDVAWPDEPFTAGDYSRLARQSLAEISARGRLPIIAGGTGLYLRALIDGLFPAPEVAPELRVRLRRTAARRGAPYLHRLLRRLDPVSAEDIHSNDTPKVVRALEVTLTGRRPMSEQWERGREPLEGYAILRIGLAPPRTELYSRIEARATWMFRNGLLEETQHLLDRYGNDCRALGSLGYAQAALALRGELSLDAAIGKAQQGHRNYAKRQGTWFRREPEIHWIAGFGDNSEAFGEARRLVSEHLESMQHGIQEHMHCRDDAGTDDG